MAALLLSSLQILVALFVIINFVNSDELENPLKFPEPVQVIERFGTVYGARDCGGLSRVLEIRHESCVTARLPAICTVPTDKGTFSQIMFVPRENLKDLEARITIITENGQSKTFEKPIKTRLTAGREYTFKANTMPTSELKGKVFTTRTEIYRKSDDKLVHLCAEADYIAF